MLRLALALLVVVAACGDSPETFDDPAEFVAELRAAECERLVACRLFADLAQCQARMPYPGLPSDIWLTPPGDAEWVAHVAAGTMEYSAERAATCIAEMRAPVCGRDEPLPACHGVFRGIAPAGTITSSWDECASGAWASQACEGACCTGTCDAIGDGGVVTTISTGGEGERCGPAAEGFQSCQYRLACRDSVCVRLGPGEECFGNIECPLGNACAGGICVPRRALGETCRRSFGGDDTCDHVGIWCDFTDHCRALALEGEACNEDGDDVDLVPCRPGLRCDESAARCVAVRAEGELCGDAPCAEGLFCGAVTDAGVVCAPKLAAGATCNEHGDCASDTCDLLAGGVCAPVASCP